MKFIIGRKIEMTQKFRTDGVVVPVTRIKAGPMVITQVRTTQKDGFTAVQVGLSGKKKLTKSLIGHTKGLGSVSSMREFRVPNVDKFSRGQTFSANVFQAGDKVIVSGTSKGKGFAGVVKRHHFKGGPASHGHKDNLRMPGSIGSTAPQRVLKGLRMAGRMGGEKNTVTNLEIIDIDETAGELYVKGAIPGPRNGLILVYGEGEMPEASAKTEVEAEAKINESPKIEPGDHDQEKGHNV